MRKKNHIDKEEFLKLVIEYQELGSEKMSTRDYNRLGEIILSLVNHIAMKPNFSRYTYLEEMKSTAYHLILKGLNTFNSTKSNNVFSYFTQTCINAFIFVINKEHMVIDKKIKYSNHLQDKEESSIDRIAKKKHTNEIKDPAAFN